MSAVRGKQGTPHHATRRVARARMHPHFHTRADALTLTLPRAHTLTRSHSRAITSAPRARAPMSHVMGPQYFSFTCVCMTIGVGATAVTGGGGTTATPGWADMAECGRCVLVCTRARV